MISRKEIAALYGCEYKKITKLLKACGIISADDHGKGRRVLLTPLEFEIFKQKIGAPIQRK